MRIIDQFYSTKNLSRNGIFILICLAVVSLISLFIPEFKIKEDDRQIYTIDGNYIKYSDSKKVSHFFNSIKNNDGVLILGTSETGRYEDGNYFDYLNNDPDLNDFHFSVLGGAGRTCGIHIPTFLSHREDVKGLKVIYFINPIYWRQEMAEMSQSYWDRDHNYKDLIDIELTDTEREKYYKPVEAYLDYLRVHERANLYAEGVIRSVHEKYFQELSFSLDPNKYYSKIEYLETNNLGLKQFPNFGVIDHEKIDTSWNASYEYLKEKGFYPIDLRTDYRYTELSSFVKLCIDLEVEITYIVGPYNKRFVEHYGSSTEFDNVITNIKGILKKSNAKYIDASIISDKAGAFRDFQHHSNFGAFHIYHLIKSEYCER